MMTHQKPIDKVFEDADDTGVLVLSGRNLRTFPVVANDLLDYSEVFEAGRLLRGWGSLLNKFLYD